MNKLMVRLSPKTFSIGYINCLPLCVYADEQAYTGIEEVKKEQKIIINSKVLNIKKINKSHFVLERAYIQYLKWCNLYLNNLDTTRLTYKGEIT